MDGYTVIWVVVMLGGLLNSPITNCCFLEDYRRVPNIVSMTSDQVKFVGDSVELVCSVIYFDLTHVVWLKMDISTNRTVPISINNKLVTKDSRYQVTQDDSLDSYTISIKDLEETDSGTYICTIIEASPERVAKQLNLEVRPRTDDNAT